MNDSASPLLGFSGTARLFPLPNLVFFPQVVQPLHIFEPRYRQMTADALAGDRFIALVLPRPGWEKDYAGSPAIHSVGALGKVVADQKMEDGRYNILLRGLSRIRIDHEIPHGKLYRKAKVELLEDVEVASPEQEQFLRQRIAERLETWFTGQEAVREQFHKLLQSELGLGGLCDILAFALPLGPDRKQELLEELDVERRLEKLLGGAAPGGERKFPPDFSAN